MEKYISYQMELFDNLKNSEKNLKKTSKERIKKPYLETRLEQLESLWNEFKEGHKNIILKISKDEDRKIPYFKNEVFETFEETFINYKSMLKEMLLPFLKSSNSQTTGVINITDSNRNGEIKLPIIKIPTFNGYTTPGRIDILLGAEVYSNVLLSGIMKHPTINLLAQNTIFGWVLSGKICNQHLSARNTVSSLHIQLKEDDILKLFWEQENEPNTIERRLSKEEERCEEIYYATTKRDMEGRFIVKLPFKTEHPRCQNGKLFEMAARRFMSLEKKLQGNQDFQREYTKDVKQKMRP
ncbi:unnamed protein product [Euphydryas editha]|uniref:Peptidase aspartic putative domain-containing protein n=1 Tax=Euphydryas editha TaxID=104508 RepID=A0AAU9VGP0_EUPED|nr:unnamed protein product [Euphydryas editha]